MVEALEHVANLERPAKRCRLVERHRDAAIVLEEDPDDEELARASAASADFIIKVLTMAEHGRPWLSIAYMAVHCARPRVRC